MYRETTEAYIKRIIGDLPEFEERINSALNSPKGKSFHLKRAGSILSYMNKNIEQALSLLFDSEIIERDKRGRITKGGKRKKNVK